MKGLNMKFSKLVLAVSVLMLFSVTFAYAGEKCKKAEKKCQEVKACKDVNDSNAVKKCAAKRQNMEKCNAQAASKGEKKGWFSSLFSKKEAAANETTCSKNEVKKCAKEGDKKCAKACAMKNKENCKKACAAKDKAKCCKKAKECKKPAADPNAPAAK